MFKLFKSLNLKKYPNLHIHLHFYYSIPSITFNINYFYIRFIEKH